MDPVTHIVSGALAGQAVRERFPLFGRLLPWFTALAAWAPDLDNLSSFFGMETYLRYHRGLTHSILGGLALAGLIAILPRVFKRLERHVSVWALAYGCVLLHIWLDLITAFGTMILLPFSDYRASLDAVFIIDPFLTGVLLICLLYSFRRETRRAAAVTGLVFCLVYPLGCIAVREAAGALFQKTMGQPPVTGVVQALPDGFSPVFWKVIVSDGGTVAVTTFDLRDPSKPQPVIVGREADRTALERLSRTASYVGTWNWFAETPMLLRSEPTDAGRKMIFADARFLSVQPALGAYFDDRYPVFAMTLEFQADALSRVVAHMRGASEVVWNKSLSDL